ncbi:hypothetical protein V6N13_126477 [Hibiscus sabdariffa]
MTFRTCQGSNYGICRGRVGEPATTYLSRIRHISCQPRFSRQGQKLPAQGRFFHPRRGQQIFCQHCGHDIFLPGHQISHLPRSLPRQALDKKYKLRPRRLPKLDLKPIRKEDDLEYKQQLLELPVAAKDRWEEQGFYFDDNLPNYGLEQFLYNRLNELGWFRLARQPARANYNWVIEFYANNLAREDFSIVRGRRVPATATTINAILGLSDAEPSFYAMLGGFEEEDFKLIKDYLCEENTAWTQ